MSEEKKSTSASRSKKAQERSVIVENEENKRELKIEVSKYKSVLDVLGDINKTWRVLMAIFFLGVILFTGIAVVASTIKRLYPYSDITTNGLGATTIKSEKKEVSYWLYNTSQLWANSGINVSEGDVLTIQSSGQYHTAIHHLYDSAQKNTQMNDSWVGSEGGVDTPGNLSPGSYYRRKYRMFPNIPTGTLVMQVVNNKAYDTSRDDNANPENFYFVGKGRQNITINHSGTLYFSLNDIVLNEMTIVGLLIDCLSDYNSICEDIDNEALLLNKKEAKVTAAEISKKYHNKQVSEYLGEKNKAKRDELFSDFVKIFEIRLKTSEKGSRAMSKYKLGVTELFANNVNGNSFDSKYVIKDSHDKCYFDYNKLKNDRYLSAVIDDNNLTVINSIQAVESVRICEMEYYLKNDYRTAWFDDNIGSFLIVIEKKTK